MRTNRINQGISWLLPIVVAAGAGVCLGQPKPPPRTHAERLTYDEKTGQWVRENPPVPGTEDGDLDIARQWVAREDYKAGLKIVKAWIKQYGNAAPRYPEALYIEGTAELGTGDYRAAHKSYQKLLNDYPGSEYAERALKADFAVGEQYLAGQKRKALWGLLRIKDREAGVKIMDDMVANYSDTQYAELAQMSKADYFFARGDFETAEQEYQTFITQFPNSGWRTRAQLQSARAALASFPGVKYDDAGLLQAEERYNQFQRTAPEAARQNAVPVILDDIAAKRAEKSFEIGRFYDKSRHFKAAAYYYRATIRQWPGTAAAARAESRLGDIGESVTPPPTTAPAETQPG